MSEMVEVVIDSIRVGLMSQQRVVILREVDAERYLAIWIDPYMAEQITFALQEVEVARPMSHDLMKNILRSLDARVIRVEVIELKGQVYYGNIVVETGGGFELNIDTRPSDALALAVRTNVPIRVASQVMDEAGIIPEEDIADEGIMLSKTQRESLEKATAGDGDEEEDEERLSVFEDFLDNLDVPPKNKKDAPDDKEDE